MLLFNSAQTRAILCAFLDIHRRMTCSPRAIGNGWRDTFRSRFVASSDSILLFTR
jgi:hypothetical protein